MRTEAVFPWFFCEKLFSEFLKNCHNEIIAKWFKGKTTFVNIFQGLFPQKVTTSTGQDLLFLLKLQVSNLQISQDNTNSI